MRSPCPQESGRSIDSVRPILRHARDNMASDEELAAAAEIVGQLRNFLAMDLKR